MFLNLVNWEDTYTSKEIVDYFRSDEAVQIMKNHKKSALVGITGVKKIFLSVFYKISKSVSVSIKIFNTEEEAKEWLVRD